MTIYFTQLEDRILILRDRVDSLAKAYNPGEPRDEKGKWSFSGGKTGGVEILSGSTFIHHPDFVYHGTSSKIAPKLFKNGLRAGTYIASHPHVAEDEAQFTVSGDKFGPRRGVGGTPVVIAVSKTKLGSSAQFTVDPEYEGGGDWGRAFITKDTIPASSLRKLSGTELEQHVLALQNTHLAKAYNPDEPRDNKGQWSSGGGGDGTPEKVKEQQGHVARAREWLNSSRIKSIVDEHYGSIKPKAKEALGHAVATAVTYFSRSGSDYDAVQESVVHLANQTEATFDAARNQVQGVLQKLREARMKELNKAADDPVIKAIDAAVKGLKALKPPKQGRMAKLEDRALVLRDQVDTLKKKLGGLSGNQRQFAVHGNHWCDRR